jgi:hypothetical protein
LKLAPLLARLALPLVRLLVLLLARPAPLAQLLVPLQVPLVRLVLLPLALRLVPLPLLASLPRLHWLACRLVRWALLAQLSRLPLLPRATKEIAPRPTTDRSLASADIEAALIKNRPWTSRSVFLCAQSAFGAARTASKPNGKVKSGMGAKASARERVTLPWML